jgi:hypothetical protein
MSGTVRGVIDAYTNESTEHKDTANMFKTWFDAFEAHPLMTRIALQYGDGGSGTDYWESATGFGRNSFAVWRLDPSAIRSWPYYIIMQSNSGGTGGTGAVFGAAPGDPATHGGTTTSQYGSLALGMAVGIGGDLNPWNGTTANDGTDDKGGSAAYAAGNDGLGKVWRIPAAGGTGLLMLPRSNNAGGDQNATMREQIYAYAQGSAIQTRYNLIMDDDNIWAAIDGGDSGGWRHVCLGPIDTHAGLTVDYPFMAASFNDPVPLSIIGQGEAGVFMPDSTDPEPVRNVHLDSMDTFTTAPQPNRLFATAEFDLLPLWVRVDETPENGLIGVFGTAADDFFLFTYDALDGSVNPGKTRVVLGSSTRAALKICGPWNGLTFPSTGFTREGIAF